ncbi:MFS transporter [Prosthecobacter sp.]|uniref:MFS transporter n=1 Tax=Prosthecobacter sp. TaxID=1965333 RepID=UPI002ABC3624|nr:MFS transporter [Prosthecobacter sp.]MDZ4406041.1 MFS transporter [Prosthecobacter sp.]
MTADTRAETPHTDRLPRAWLIVGVLWVVAALNYLDRIMITTMRDSLTQAVPMTDAQFGLLTSVFLWVYGLLSPFAGFLADRFNRSRLIVFSLLVWSLLTWLTGHARSFEELIVVRALMGLSEAAYLPAALALIADYHRGSTRSLATGIHMTGLSVGTGLAGIGGWVAEKHGWAAAFDVFGLFGVAYAVGLLFVLRDPPRESGDVTLTAEQPRLGQALVSLFSSGSFILLLAFWGLLALAGWAVMGWMPTFFKEQFKLDQGAAGISATSYLAVAMLLGKLVGGVWADRWSKTNNRARILVPAIGLFIAAPATLLVANTSVLAFAIAGLSIYGFTRVFSDANLMPILCQVSDSRYRATGYGVLNMFSCIVGGITVYVGGALRDAQISVSTLFQCAAGGLLVCGVLMTMVRPAQTRIPTP